MFSPLLKPESALDLECAGRDELLDGERALVVLQPAETPGALERPASQRCGTAARELAGQSSVLKSADLQRLAEQKPR